MIKRKLSVMTLAVAVVAVSLFAADGFAHVSLRNGNFFMGYTDLLYPGGIDPKIERIYNSKTNYTSGMFGPGWGFEFEANLTVSADGSVVVHEYGGGAENRFNPAAFNAAQLDEAVKTLGKAAQATGRVSTVEQLNDYMKKIRGDANMRNEEWERYRRLGKVQARALPVGTKLQSNRFSLQYITRVANGYVRNFETGKTETYNDAGKLVKVTDKNGNFMNLSYSKEGKLDKIVDNFNRRIAFHYNALGRVDRIEGENGKKATYEYNNKGILAKSVDTGGGVYTYKYDDVPGVPNMTEIGYSDNTTVKVSYYPVDKGQNVKTYKDRDGTLTEYSYGNRPSDPGYYSVAFTVKDSSGKKISSSKYEYFLKRKADGEEWNYKIITAIDGDKTETTYNECCGLPLLINHNGEETAFVYDTKGHVTKKTTPNEVTELTYDQNVGKVSKVVRYVKNEPKKASWSQFQYDGKGNLIFAQNSEKKGVRLFYDRVGRISSMVDQSRRKIEFKYNENSKPIEITDPALGSITVSYNNSGEIKKVESTAGRKIAVQVTSAFQNLLEIIRPAGVSLSF